MLAKTLFGLENRWGKLPYTIYGQDYTNQVDFDNYDSEIYIYEYIYIYIYSGVFAKTHASSISVEGPRPDLQVLHWDTAVQIWVWAVLHSIHGGLHAPPKQQNIPDEVELRGYR